MIARSGTPREWSAVARQHEGIARLGRCALETTALDRLLAEAIVVAADVLQADAVVVFELRAGSQLNVRMAVHEAGGRPALVGRALPSERRLQAGETAVTGAAIAGEEGVTAAIGDDGDRWGVIGAFGHRPREYTADEVGFLRSVGDLLGLAIGRRLAEDRLRSTATGLDESLAAGGLGSWQWEPATDQVRLSASLERLLGIAPGAFTGRGGEDALALVHHDDRAVLVATARTTVAERRGYEMTCRVVRDDGETRWFEIRGQVVVDDAGAVQRVVGVAADITERQEARQRLAFLARASASLSSSLNPQVIFRNLANLASSQLCDVSLIDTFDADGALSESTVGDARPDLVGLVHEVRRSRLNAGGDGLWSVRRVVRTGRSELLSDITDEHLQRVAADGPHLDLLRTLAPRSAMVVPLVARGRVLGGMTMLAVRGSRRFDDADLSFAEDLAGRAAMAVDNARLFESRSLVARTLQASLLPPALPELAGMDIAARYRVGQGGIEIGGDFYDVFEVSDGRWAVVVGDVCGRGPEAAALTGLMRHSVRAAAVRDDRPSRVLSQANDAILDQIDDTRFCTAAFVRVLLPDGPGSPAHLSVSCGGHPRPFVVRADGSVEQVDAAGTLLGVLPRPPLVDAAVELEPGASLVLYTDGLTEARRGGEQFGEERVRQVLEGTQHLDAAALGGRVEDAVRDFQDDSNDDMAVVILRTAPGEPTGGAAAPR